jgi:LysR family transcriptional regulator, glycine cleavage system transcriptional activator
MCLCPDITLAAAWRFKKNSNLRSILEKLKYLPLSKHSFNEEAAMTKLPPMRALQAFEAFGRLGSATAAAAELGVTVGAISQQLRKAEDQIGLRLIERQGKSIALSSRGRQYHADISAGFDQLRTAQARLDETRLNNTLTISCLPSLATKWIGAQIFDWQIAHPAARVLLIGDDNEPDFATDPVDFRLSYGELITRFPNRSELFSDWAVPACSPSLLSQLDLKRAADILAAPLLGIEWNSRQGAAVGWADWASLVGVASYKAKEQITFSLSSAAIDAAINGRGFVLAQLSMATQDIATGRLVVPFDLRLPLLQPYWLAWDASALEKPYGSELRSWLQTLARRQKLISAPSMPKT